MTSASRSSDRYARKIARRKLLKGLITPGKGGYKMAKVRKK